MQHGAVLDDQSIEQFRFGEHGGQVVELPAGDEQQPSTRSGQPLQRIDGGAFDTPAACQRAVKVRGKCNVAHSHPCL